MSLFNLIHLRAIASVADIFRLFSLLLCRAKWSMPILILYTIYELQTNSAITVCRWNRDWIKIVSPKWLQIASGLLLIFSSYLFFSVMHPQHSHGTVLFMIMLSCDLIRTLTKWNIMLLMEIDTNKSMARRFEMASHRFLESDTLSVR